MQRRLLILITIIKLSHFQGEGKTIQNTNGYFFPNCTFFEKKHSFLILCSKVTKLLEIRQNFFDAECGRKGTTEHDPLGSRYTKAIPVYTQARLKVETIKDVSQPNFPRLFNIPTAWKAIEQCLRKFEVKKQSKRRSNSLP